MKPIFTEADIISVYTRADALRDGVLVNISALFPITRRLYKYPIAFTASIWNIIETCGHENPLGEVLAILIASQRNITTPIDEACHLFGVILEGSAPQERWTFKIQVHASDDFSPCITVMQENED